MTETTPTVAGTTVVRVQRTVSGSASRVFELFTGKMESWWPKSHRLGPSERADVVLEAHEGGRWYERGIDGETCDWGRVLVWDPPNRIVLSWQIAVGFKPEPDPSRASRVEVVFDEVSTGQTTITLTHTAFERHGEGWEAMRDGVAGPGGWPDILAELARLAPGDGTTVHVYRRLNATPERVFDAWLDPALLGSWMFGPDVRDEEIVRLTTDPQVGGFYSFAVRREGELIDHVGTYFELERPHRLAFTWGIAGESGEQSHVLVEITGDEGGCSLVLAHVLDAAWRDYEDATMAAWEHMLDKLQEVLA